MTVRYNLRVIILRYFILIRTICVASYDSANEKENGLAATQNNRRSWWRIYCPQIPVNWYKSARFKTLLEPLNSDWHYWTECHISYEDDTTLYPYLIRLQLKSPSPDSCIASFFVGIVSHYCPVILLDIKVKLCHKTCKII